MNRSRTRKASTPDQPTDGKRPYRMQRRAETQEETRQRILEATIALHEELGPRATSISAIAERAGVQRLTVYRHFPDDEAVFQACTSEWGRRNPPPDPSAWQGFEQPAERIRAALQAFHRYYAGTRRMWSVGYREAPDVPAIQPAINEFDQLLDGIAASLAPGRRGSKAHARALATIRHALAFQTWESLRGQGLGEGEVLDLVMSWMNLGVRG